MSFLMLLKMTLRHREAKCPIQFRNLLFYNVEAVPNKTKPRNSRQPNCLDYPFTV